MKRLTTRKITTLVALLIFLLLSIWKDSTSNNSILTSVLSENIESSISRNEQNDTDQIIVERVIDGDTIVINGNIHVRYIGINTPEITKGKSDCFGPLAFEENKRLVESKYVTLEKDVSETDKYGRLLRYVYVDGVMINNELVKNGFARSSTYPPDVKYQSLFKESELSARTNNLGLWTECN